MHKGQNSAMNERFWTHSNNPKNNFVINTTGPCNFNSGLIQQNTINLMINEFRGAIRISEKMN